MVPIRLDITNFLSYRETQTLDFSQIHLAGISGQNGAGKSTLLEAITWALFGRSRSRSDDDIVNRLSAKDGKRAEVQLTFELEDQRYRVVRRKKAGGRMMLEFQLRRDEENWSTLSETKTRETQAKIERTLGMNYDTFVNISFFLQGQADEFTTKTAGQRKEILADLLGVNEWDRYRERAGEARKSAENHQSLLDHRINDIDTELLSVDERAANLEALAAELEKTNAQLETQTVLLNQLRKAAESAEQKARDVESLKAKVDKEQARKVETAAALQERETERAAFQQLLDQRDAIEQAQRAFTAAQEAFEALQTKANQFNQTQQAMRPHELAIAQTQSKLTQQRSELMAQSERVAAMQGEQKTVAQTLGIQREAVAGLEKDSAEISQQETALNAAKAALQKTEADRRLLQQEAAQLQKESTLIGQQQAEQSRLTTELAAAQARLDGLSDQVVKLNEQKTEVAALKTKQQTLSTIEQPRLNARIEKLKVRLKRLEDEVEGVCPVCGRELTDDHRAKVIADVKLEGAPIADDFRANKRKLAEWQQTIGQLETRIKSSGRLDRDLQAAQQQVAKIEARSAEIVRAETAWNDSKKADRLATLNQQLADDEGLRNQQAEVNQLAQAVGNKRVVEGKLQAARKQVAEMEARSAEIERAVAAWSAEGSQALKLVSEALDNDSFEPEARSALAEAQKQLSAIGYDKAAHAEARVQRDALSEAASRFAALQSAEAALKPLNDNIDNMRGQLKALDESLAELHQQIADGAAQLESLRLDSADLRHVETQVNALRQTQSEANRRVGAAQQKVDVLKDQRQKRKEVSAEREEVTQRISQLKQIEKACGRDGIQALLIERALPEIEDSANQLLDQLTDGVMRVAFETQRQLKSSDNLRETLDIHILDSNGDRPYENYSGGEKFRINFAIRLALSQILSKRSGARLQTLVIDEGFGSQDPRGRQRLVEAIKAIEPDFACILVITHVEELRDAFETRIEVSKTTAGSTIVVN